MTPITREHKLSQLAVDYPAAAGVFHRHRIDFCCAGSRTLQEACAKAGLDPEQVIREIELGQRALHSLGPNWSTRPLAELIDFILTEYHAPLRPELGRLQAMANKVRRVHGSKDPERLTRLAQLVAQLSRDMYKHMAKEAELLFPWFLLGRGASAGGPVAVMQYEHENAAAHLQEIEELTGGFQPPTVACSTWRALYLGLQELDAALKDQMHLENNVLFVRALNSPEPGM